MTENELKNRLRAMTGEIPAETHSAFLNASCYGKEEKKVRKKWTVGTIVAFALLILSMGTALAASEWDVARLMDIWRPYETVEEDPTRDFSGDHASGETELASFSVRQAYHDGKNVYAVLEVKPKDDETLVLGIPMETDQMALFLRTGVFDYDQKGEFWSQPEGERKLPMKALGPAFANSEQTLGEWMDAAGKTKIIYAFSTLSIKWDDYDPAQKFGFPSYDWALQEDGSLLIFRGESCVALRDSVTCTEHCFVENAPRSQREHGYIDEDFIMGQDLTTVSFTVRAHDARHALRVEGPFLFSGQEGYQADWVSVSVSPFGLEVSVSWQFPAPEYLGDSDLAEDHYLSDDMIIRIDSQHENNADNATYSADQFSTWGQTHRNCYGVQTVLFPDITDRPDTVYLICNGEELSVPLNWTVTGEGEAGK